MRVLRRPLIVIATIAGLAACDSIIGLTRPLMVGPDAGTDSGADARSDSRTDARTDAGRPACFPLPRSKTDPGRGTLFQLTSVVTSPDAGNSGVGCSWMDRAEVTVQQYAKWLTADPTPAWDSVRCAWKGASATPASPSEACPIPPDEVDPYDPALPIRCVDWCDALTFCAYYGARLCWSGTAALIGNVDPSLPEYDEWGGACGGPADNLFSYGNTTTSGPAGSAPTATVLTPRSSSTHAGRSRRARTRVRVSRRRGRHDRKCARVGSPLCPERGHDPLRGAWRRLERPGGYDPVSLRFGGGFGSPPSSILLEQNRRDAYTGFRCCADLTAAEQQKVTAR